MTKTTIAQLICEYRSNPLGIDVTQPRLGWQMQTNRLGAKQRAYQIQASSSPDDLDRGNANLWNSGKIESEQSVHVVWEGQALQSRQRVYWKVTVWDETGEASTSEIAWFEMGLLHAEDWQAEWIGSSLAGGTRSTIPAPYLRKTFNLPAPVESARLYVTALGLFEASINGKVVSEDIFAPGWTDYRKRVQYLSYDVRDLLHEGENAFGAVLGDGWAVGYIAWLHRQNYVDRPQFLAQLEIQFADGSRQTILSDSSWAYQFGAITHSDFLQGEAYDARREMPNWNTVNFDSSAWYPVEIFKHPETRLVAHNSPTVQKIQELPPIVEPINRGTMGRKRWLFDLGQNMVGRVRFKGAAPAGSTVVIRYAEILNPDGSPYYTNLRTAHASDYYTFKGVGEEVWESTFTFHGFRYVEIEGYAGTVNSETITGIVLHSALEQTGHFECSDPLLNQLQSNILWGQKGNFVDVPTDCPQRDERLGWTGDIQVFASTAAFNMNIASFMTKWARDVQDAQNPDGSVPSVVPYAADVPKDGGPAWADAVIICPWTMYLSYGDKRILEENYHSMACFLDFLQETASGFIRCAPDYEGWPGFGDWLSVNASTPRDLLGTAFFAYDAQLMAKIAAILGKADDAAAYQALSEQVKNAFAERYLIGSSLPAFVQPSEARRELDQADALSRGRLKFVDYGKVESKVFNTELFTPSQTAYVLALHFDLLPEDLQQEAVTELVQDIERRGLHLSTGFAGSPYLNHVLSRFGCLDTAYALLNQKSWPSWLYAVTQGATTIWERWDGWTEESGFQTPDMNSFNHYAYGAIGAWLYGTVAGIEIDPQAAGYKHSVFAPQPDGSLSFARAELDTLYGKLVSAWKYRDGVFDYEITIPPNTSTTVRLPFDGTVSLDGKNLAGKVHELGAGNYHFVVRQ
jgi:alpha-L-rhamnosidase